MKIGIGLIGAGVSLLIWALKDMITMQVLGSSITCARTPLVVAPIVGCCSMLLIWGVLRARASVKKAKAKEVTNE